MSPRRTFEPNPYSKPPGTCALGYCLAPERPRSKYCSPEHGALARDEQDARSQAKRDVNAHLERIVRGEVDPIPYTGVFFSNSGAALSGDVVDELLRLIAAYERVVTTFERALRRPGANPADLVRDWDIHVKHALTRLLADLRRVLPKTERRP